MGKSKSTGASSPPRGLDITSSQDVFESIEEMTCSLESIARYLRRRYLRKKGSADHGLLGFVIQRLSIVTTNQVREMEVVSHYADGSVTIMVPPIPGESRKLRERRRMEVLSYFLPSLKDAQLRATVQLYRALRVEARKRLIEESEK